MVRDERWRREVPRRRLFVTVSGRKKAGFRERAADELERRGEPVAGEAAGDA
jgi:hypothetical protein